MENELAFYIAQGVGGGPSVMDKRYEFYRAGRPVGLSSDDYRRLYFLDLLGLANSDLSTQDLEAQWFAQQGFERAAGFAAAYVGQASLGGVPFDPLVSEIYTNPSGLGNITYDDQPQTASVALPDPATENLVAGDFLALAIRSQNGTVGDPFVVAGDHVASNNWAAARTLSFLMPRAPIVPKDPETGPSAITVTRTAANSRTVYAPIFLRNVNPNNVKYQLAAGSGGITWGAPIQVTSDNTTLMLIIGWEATATNDPNYGPSAGVMAGADLTAAGRSSTDTGVTRTQIAVFTKVVDKGTYGMADGNITVLSGTGVGSGITATLVAIGPKVKAVPKVATWLAKNKFQKLSAHRGGSTKFPEMSDYAYANAVGIGYECLEISMQRSSDGVWVGCHDRYLDRTSLGTETTTLDITAMDWATIQTHEIDFANGRTPQPYARFIDIVADYGDHAIFMVDPKNSSAFLSEWLDLLDSLGGPEKFLCKFSGPGAALTHRATCAARGYKVWGYYFEGEDFTNAGLYDIVGLNNSAAQATWDALKAFGRPVLGHIIQSQANYDEALAKGADGFQVGATTTIYPG